ncbi:hypothetical protein [Fervidibacter sp.]|jgi:hypothetical protein
MARRDTQQSKKRTTVAATTVALPLSPSAAPAQPTTEAGFIVFPNGIRIPAELQVAPEPDKLEWHKGRLVPVKNFYEILQRKKRFLRRMARHLWLAYRREFIGFSFFLTAVFQLVLQALRSSLPRPNRLETLLDALLEQLLRLSQKANRSPPEKPADVARKPSPSWLSPTIPAFCRAPDAAARLAWRVAG